MTAHLEIEYKTLLTALEYLSLDEHFEFDEIKEQTNYYYDSNNELLDKKMMCRIREVNGEYEFTLKVPQDIGVLEYEVILPEKNIHDEAALNILKPFISNPQDLKEVGYSSTLRKISKDEYGEWCLDYNEFSDHKDFELEYELYKAHPKAQDHYLKEIKKLSIELKHADPKYIRALESKKK